MKAFAVTHYGPDGLEAVDVPEPRLGPRDVLIDIRAASINPLDKMVRDGEFKQLLKYKPQFVLGHDLSGVVRAVGTQVGEFKPEDEVYARPRDLRVGAFAERIAVDVDDIALKPASLSFAEAAAVPLVALAAWQALVDVAAIRPGRKVLVHARAGGLGSTVVQVAKHLGAYVATTVSTKDVDKARALGADEVIDYKTQDFVDVLSGYDVVLDSLVEENLRKSLTVLRPGGLAVSVVGPPDPDFACQLGQPLFKPVMALLSNKIRRRARKLGVRYAFLFMRASGPQLATLAALYDAGNLRPVLDRTFPFAQTLDAMAYVEQGKANGKVVVTR